jgi:proteasome lid subunit RPN8/RPN11
VDPTDGPCGRCPQCGVEFPGLREITWLTPEDVRSYVPGTVPARLTAPTTAKIISGDDLPPHKPQIKVPRSLIERFKDIAQPNTSNGIETLGYIMGKYSERHRAVTATVLLVPRQGGSREACWDIPVDADGAVEAWLLKQTELQTADSELKAIGWIHTHPTYTYFFSNVDSHMNADLYWGYAPFFGIVVGKPTDVKSARFGVNKIFCVRD